MDAVHIVAIWQPTPNTTREMHVCRVCCQQVLKEVWHSHCQAGCTGWRLKAHTERAAWHSIPHCLGCCHLGTHLTQKHVPSLCWHSSQTHTGQTHTFLCLSNKCSVYVNRRGYKDIHELLLPSWGYYKTTTQTYTHWHCFHSNTAPTPDPSYINHKLSNRKLGLAG